MACNRDVSRTGLLAKKRNYAMQLRRRSRAGTSRSKRGKGASSRGSEYYEDPDLRADELHQDPVSRTGSHSDFWSLGFKV